MNLGSLPLLERLANCRRILLVGAGGGFDVMTGVPLFHYLQTQGKEVFLGSLSFSDLTSAWHPRQAHSFVEVRPDTPARSGYFPERYLSEWYASHGQQVPIYSFKPGGARSTLCVYEELVRHLDLDGLVLVDGGTDSLMRGDEPGLGTPAEDMTSIAAAHMLELPVRLLANLGFGVDAHHGVCHAHVLEAVADLTAQGSFLGAFSLLPGMPEFEAFAQAVEYVCGRMPGRESIVNTSIVAAGRGRFGDHHPTSRTQGSSLFINPLMSMYWCFEVDGVARRCLYLDYLRDTYSRWDVHRAIHNYLYTVTPREWLNIPF
ncbi:MAG: DUF1152 domain-containing protein [Armatimonadetes bacterium]|nr:DUF1152 domain-containing protein [Armatimonadota bacterium]